MVKEVDGDSLFRGTSYIGMTLRHTANYPLHVCLEEYLVIT